MSVKTFEEQKMFAPFLGEPLSHIVGQDPLGLLNTGGKTFDLLLPGLNNVTDRIRYYSFYGFTEIPIRVGISYGRKFPFATTAI